MTLGKRAFTIAICVAVKKNSRKLEGGSLISVKRKGGSKMIRNHVVSNLAATTAKRTSVCLVCRENG